MLIDNPIQKSRRISIYSREYYSSTVYFEHIKSLASLHSIPCIQEDSTAVQMMRAAGQTQVHTWTLFQVPWDMTPTKTPASSVP